MYTSYKVGFVIACSCNSKFSLANSKCVFEDCVSPAIFHLGRMMYEVRSGSDLRGDYAEWFICLYAHQACKQFSILTPRCSVTC